jgi:uncharacterized protein
MLRFECDAKKNRSNRSKHGIWFEEAQTVCDDPHRRFFVDPEHSNEEERFTIIGMSSADRLVLVIECDGLTVEVSNPHHLGACGKQERPDFTKKEFNFSKL